jgi:hypothetical protein
MRAHHHFDAAVLLVPECLVGAGPCGLGRGAQLDINCTPLVRSRCRWAVNAPDEPGIRIIFDWQKLDGFEERV